MRKDYECCDNCKNGEIIREENGMLRMRCKLTMEYHNGVDKCQSYNREDT